MKRNFCVHPYNIAYIDPLTTDQVLKYIEGPNTNICKYTITDNKNSSNQSISQTVKLDPIDCALSNSLKVFTKFCVFRQNNTTQVPNPWPYYTASGILLEKCRPKINLWLKKDKNPSTYNIQNKITTLNAINYNGLVRSSSILELELESIQAFDTFQIEIVYQVTLSIPVIGEEDTGTTQFSRNKISPLTPFNINTYWKY